MRPNDRFCGTCGASQPGAAGATVGAGAGTGAAAAFESAASGLKPNTAAVLCYAPFVGWVFSVVVLASEKFRALRDVRFHAFQGLYLFVVWLIVDWVLKPALGWTSYQRKALGLVELGVVATSVYMMVKTSQNVLVRLPVLGELAEKSVSEQR